MPKVCEKCDGLGGRMSRYGPGYTRLPDGRLDGWPMSGKKDCEPCNGTGFVPEETKVTDKGVMIVYRNHDGIVKEYFIVPHEKMMRFDFPWTGHLRDDEVHKVGKTWVVDADVVRSPDNVRRTFVMDKIIEWKKG